MNKTAILKARAILGLMLLTAAIVISGGLISRYRGDEAVSASSLNYHIRLSGDEAANDRTNDNIVGLNDIIFAPLEPLIRPSLRPLSDEYIGRLSNFDYLTSRIFLVDRNTILLPIDIDVPAFLEMDLTIDTTASGPQILIFHTHSMEEFIDSDLNDPMGGIMGVGRYLAQILAEVHGIETLHYTGRFDMVSGISHRPGAYERMEPVIRQILADNPSIQMIIDLHRDGVPENHPPFVTYIDGQRTAQIMFFNGLSRRYRNGEVTNLHWLHNPYQQENLAFSFNMQMAANQLYPGIARRIYLREFRYSLHMLPLSTLIEVGAQNNTKQEALNAMHPLANIIAAVVLGGE